jgi:hypothetical protein
MTELSPTPEPVVTDGAPALAPPPVAVLTAPEEPTRDAGGSRRLGSRRRNLRTRDLIGEPPTWSERVWWTLAGVILVEWSIRIYASVTTFPWVTVPVVVAGFWGLLTVGGSWAPVADRARLRPWRSAWGWTTAVLVVGIFVLWAILQVHQSPGYGTDEIAFDQYAGVLGRHGFNPYVHSMAPSFNLFRVPPDGFTYTLSGTPVTQLSYPALSFELYIPFLALGWSTQLAVGLNVGAWVVSILLLFALLPRRVRAAALVLGSLTTYVAYTVGGVTDVLYVPLLIGAAYRWNRFPTESGWRKWRGPVLLGLAMAVKQEPWLLLPFVAVALVLESDTRLATRQRLRVGVTYAGAAVAAFALPNLPYFFADPPAWVRGVLTPFIDHAVPTGQGAIGLSVFLHLGGGSLTAYSIFTVVVFVGLLAVFAATYPVLRPLTFLMPCFVLFFAVRSFSSYIVWMLPVALLAAVTSTREEGEQRAVSTPNPVRAGKGVFEPPASGERVPWRHWPWVVCISSIVCVGTLTVAMTSSAPLAVEIVGLRTTGQLATVGLLQVHVANTSSATVRPAFTLDEGGSFTTFWPASSGPNSLRPGRQATYTLRAPNFPSQAPIGGGFQVAVFTTSPAAVSVSPAYVPASLHVGLSPDAFNGVISVGQPLTVHAQLLNQFNRPVATSGVSVYLGQIIYDQRGLIYSQASINGRAPGQTPVAALTNRAGVATFTIVGTRATLDPVSFEANLVSSTQYYPYGYSEIVTVQFGRR